MPINRYIIIIFFFFLLAGYFLQDFKKNEIIDDLLQLKFINKEEKLNNTFIKVKIDGCVSSPGCYSLAYGKCLKDLISSAHGLLRPYAERSLPYYSLLKDGEEYFIPYRKIQDGDRININKASEGLLAMLPGIGEVLAGRILDYRKENRGFRNKEEMKNISGIGNKKFELIKNFIIIE